MKSFFSLAAISLLFSLATHAGSINPDFGRGDFKRTFPPATAKAWNMTGTWFVAHTGWSGPLTFKSDGLIYNPQNGLEGQWIVTAQEGELHLILRWNKWTADNLWMINGNEFYGCNGNCEIWLRRVEPSGAEAKAGQLTGDLEIRSWHQGEAPVKIMRKDEGFCALTKVAGHFEGSGESVKVYVADDVYWYLEGTSMQNDVAADCIVVRYKNVGTAETVKLGEPSTPTP